MTRIRRFAAVVAMVAATATGCTSGGGSGSGKDSSTATRDATTVATTPTAATPTAGSSTAPLSNPASAINPLAGDWNGTFQSKKFPTTSGTFTVHFTVNGSAVKGTVRLESACVRVGTVLGTLSGAAIDFGVVKSGTTAIRFTGTIQGRSLSGTYTAGASCGSDHGTWRANKH